MDTLRVENGRIAGGQGQPVRLRGVCIGGWMNMEHFIDGYPGCEHSLRAMFAQVLGPDRGRFFFDRLLDYFFAEDDVAFIKKCGASVVRLPLNYRHFESDAEPFQYLEAGFERLDRALGWCTRHGLYAILDLHAVQGWQNPDWHCDNPTRYALFWQHPHFQDRFVALWEEFARRYKGNPAVAGYNVMNEPVTGAIDGRFERTYRPRWDVLNHVYRRVVNAIRKIDPDHIIFLEGDLYSTRFEGLDEPFADNLVYSSHNYHRCGFSRGPYPGIMDDEHWDRERQERMLTSHEGVQYAQKHNVPLWSGEFGAVQSDSADETAAHMRALDDQVDIFEGLGLHWTTWTYKAVGGMSWVQANPESEYIQASASVIETERSLAKDIRDRIKELAKYVKETLGDPEIDFEMIRDSLDRAIMAGYVARLAQPVYVECFKDMTETEIDRVLQSFVLKNCKQNQELIAVLKKHMVRPA